MGEQPRVKMAEESPGTMVRDVLGWYKRPGTAGSWCWDRSGKRAWEWPEAEAVGGQEVPLSERAGTGLSGQN